MGSCVDTGVQAVQWTGPLSSWGPRTPIHKNFYAMAKFTYDNDMLFYIICNMEK